MNDNNYIKKNLITIGLTLFTLAIIFLLIYSHKVILLIFMSILFAMLIDGLANLILKYIKLKKPYSTVASLLIIFLIIGLLAWVAGPPIIEQIIVLSENIPIAFNKLLQSIRQTFWGQQILSKIPDADQLMPYGSDVFMYLTGFFSSTFSFIANFLIILILGIYLAFDPNIYIKNLALLLPPGKKENYFQLIDSWELALKWWLVGRFLSMFVVGFLTYIGLLIIGMNLTLSLSVVAALLSFIPFIGPILALVPAVLMGFTHGLNMVLYVLIVYFVVQQIESYIITPVIELKTVSLPPVLVISAQILMGIIFGFFGVLLASPITIVIIIAIQILYIKGVLKENVKILGK